jgi:uncharacterized membrane protein
MAPTPLVVYVATYESVDQAEDDFAGVRRLQRDGVIAPRDHAVIARDAGDRALRRNATLQTNAEAGTEQLVDWVLGLLFPVSLSGDAERDLAARSVTSDVPAWMLDEDVQDCREQLASATAAVVVVGALKLAPALRVALARATTMLDKHLTADGDRLADGLQMTAGALV